MNICNGIVVVEDFISASPTSNGVKYYDVDKSQVFLSSKIVVHAYEILKYHIERSDTNWEVFCDRQFK